MKNIDSLIFSKTAALFLIFSCCCLTQVFAQSKKAGQTSFSSEGKITKAVKLPAKVLKQLGAYNAGQLAECQKDKSLRKTKAADHFAASALNFNGDNVPDLIVQAQTPCFMGAHNTTFWIFTRSNQKSNADYKMAFDIAADFLKILDTSTNNFRNIETASHTAVELYTIRWKYDGEKYQKSECTISDENDKVSKVECNP